MHRLFIAIDLPDTIKDALVGLGVARLDGARPVRREHMHLTLRFIGEVDTEAMNRIREQLGMARGAPFDLSLRGVGRFPPQGAARVLWAGVSAPSALTDWHQQIESALSQLGYPPDAKGFTPHITLARFKTPPPQAALRRFIDAHRTFTTAPFPARQLTLYESTLTPQGPRYRAVAVWDIV